MLAYYLKISLQFNVRLITWLVQSQWCERCSLPAMLVQRGLHAGYYVPHEVLFIMSRNSLF